MLEKNERINKYTTIENNKYFAVSLNYVFSYPINYIDLNDTKDKNTIFVRMTKINLSIVLAFLIHFKI